MSLKEKAIALRGDVEEIIDGINNTFDGDDEAASKKVVLSIYKAIDDMDNGWLPSAEHLAKVAVATCKNIQVRDFLMGLHLERDTNTIGAYLEIIGLAVRKEFSHPAITVLSTYNYMMGEKETAVEIVKDILKAYPDYSLANLLDRIYPVFSEENMKSMAAELHPKVKENLGLDND